MASAAFRQFSHDENGDDDTNTLRTMLMQKVPDVAPNEKDRDLRDGSPAALMTAELIESFRFGPTCLSKFSLCRPRRNSWKISHVQWNVV